MARRLACRCRRRDMPDNRARLLHPGEGYLAELFDACPSCGPGGAARPVASPMQRGVTRRMLQVNPKRVLMCW